MFKHLGAAIALLTTTAAPIFAETTFTVLGSNGGPIARGDRSQPANLLTVNGRQIVVDAGDGLSVRLAAKQVRMGDIDDVVLSHIHFDHISGLLTVLGLRFQTNPPAPVNIYGPPGTKALIDGMLEGMGPAMEAGYGMEGATTMTPEELVTVQEIRGGDSFQLGDEVTVTAVENTHYSFPEGGELDEKYDALSFRFETPDRSIVYTGDTGWSDELNSFSEGADLLVVEMMDLDSVMDTVRQTAPENLHGEIEAHLSAHHLVPEEVGRMASIAQAGEVVATHLVVGARIAPEMFETWSAAIAENYDGPVNFAEDLQDY